MERCEIFFCDEERGRNREEVEGCGGGGAERERARKDKGREKREREHCVIHRIVLRRHQLLSTWENSQFSAPYLNIIVFPYMQTLSLFS